MRLTVTQSAKQQRQQHPQLASWHLQLPNPPLHLHPQLPVLLLPPLHQRQENPMLRWSSPRESL